MNSAQKGETGNGKGGTDNHTMMIKRHASIDKSGPEIMTNSTIEKHVDILAKNQSDSAQKRGSGSFTNQRNSIVNPNIRSNSNEKNKYSPFRSYRNGSK